MQEAAREHVPSAGALHSTPLARTPTPLTAHMPMHMRMRACACAHVRAHARALRICTQVLGELQLNLRLGASERAAVVAQEFEGCTFLFAKLVGLRHLVESADPRWLLELLQTTFDSFDTLAETFSVQRVRKTVNESYMVAAGLPDPTLLRSPVDRALATAGFGLALCGVMDVLNAQMAQRMGGRGGKHGASRGAGGAPPMLAVQVGINSGSAIAGVIGHRRIQYDLVGDAVNTAARMCSYGAPGRVHVSADTYEHLAPHYLATSRGPLQVCTRPPAVTPPHLCTAAPLHLRTSAPLRLRVAAPLPRCTPAPPHPCPAAPLQIKGKGLMTTYFLERLSTSDTTEPPVAEPAAQEARGRRAAVSRAREEAEAAAAIAVAKANALERLERAMADAGEGSSSEAAGPLEAGEAAEAPDTLPAVTPADLRPAGWHAPPAVPVPPDETPSVFYGD